METGAKADPRTAPGTKTKEYVRPIPATWWLSRPAYTKFMVRELTSAFLAGYAVFLVILVRDARDEAAFSGLFNALKSPVSIVLHLIVLAFALFHSITFFDLTPRVLRAHRGEERVPDRAIAGAHYAAWLVLSLILIAIALVAGR
jgi:fumarate reductase subunit C